MKNSQEGSAAQNSHVRVLAQHEKQAPGRTLQKDRGGTVSSTGLLEDRMEREPFATRAKKAETELPLFPSLWKLLASWRCRGFQSLDANHFIT